MLNKKDEAIVEGVLFITGRYPDYDTEEMIEKGSGRHYCLNHLIEVSNTVEMRYHMVQMLIFDFLIGNSDRHQNNWAVLVGYEEQGKPYPKGRFCPLYDNGSLLCSYVTAEQAKELLGNDKTRFEALVDTKSRSMIRIDGSNKKRPTHKEMVQYLLEKYPETREIVKVFIDKLHSETIDEVVDMYTDIVEYEKLELVKRFLKRKIGILGELRGDVR